MVSNKKMLLTMDIMVSSMRDIHSHVSYGIDDGAKTKEEAIELLKREEEKKVTDIILTPHYIKNSKYQANEEVREKIRKELQSHTNINLYLGNEVYICEDILSLLEKKEISTLNHSKYLLVELPMTSKLRNLEDIMYQLIRNGIIPIIAHPERYLYVQQDVSYLNKYLEMGVLFQSNYGSILGLYGKNAQKTVKTLLKRNYISFLGSDLHEITKSYDVTKLQKKLKRMVKNQERIDDLLKNNILKVIHNENIS